MSFFQQTKVTHTSLSEPIRHDPNQSLLKIYAHHVMEKEKKGRESSAIQIGIQRSTETNGNSSVQRSSEAQ